MTVSILACASPLFDHTHQVMVCTAKLVEAFRGDSALNSYFCDTLTSPTEQVSNWEISLYEPWLLEWMAHLTGVSEVVLVLPEASTISTLLHPKTGRHFWKNTLTNHWQASLCLGYPMDSG